VRDYDVREQGAQMAFFATPNVKTSDVAPRSLEKIGTVIQYG
jgi:hypothetical protein